MAEALLSLRGLTHRFSGLAAADSVLADIAAGELVGLIGPGAGKTTLFNLISGVSPPDGGPGRSRLSLGAHRQALAGVDSHIGAS